MGKRKRAVPPEGEAEECSIPSKRMTRSASRIQRELEGVGGNSAVVTPPLPPGGGGPGGSSSSNFNTSANQSQDPGREAEELSPHPLFNQVILSKLFSLCSHEVLATWRRVCKTWREVSLPNWTSTSKVKIRDDDYRDVGITVGGGDKYGGRPRKDKTTFNDFLKYWEMECRTWTTPYRHFRLMFLNFGPAKYSGSPSRDEEAKKQLFDRKEKEIARFLELVGDSVTSLTLEYCSFASVETFGKVLYHSFPNLESLTLSMLSITGKAPSNISEPPEYYEGPLYGEQPQVKSLIVDTRTNRSFPVPWIELLSHFPSLTSLKFRHPLRFEHGYRTYSAWSRNCFKDQVTWLLKAIALIRGRDGSKLPLTDFDIDPAFGLEVSSSEYSNSISSLIQTLKLPRKSARLRFDCDVGLLKELLKVHRGTLTKLEALMDTNDEVSIRGRWEEGGITSPSFPCSFPFGSMLESLQELTISNRFTTNLEFLRFTPNLKRLRIYDGAINYNKLEPLATSLVSNTSKTEMENVRLMKLKQLYLGYVITPNDLRCLMNWLPKVEMLSMFLDNEQFSIVCAGWRDLRHLHCLGKELPDQGITGITQSGGRAKAVVIRPNITFLTKLTCFKIVKGRSNFSESSVYNGFLKLSNLRTLDVGINIHHICEASRKASEEGVEKLLKEKVPNCSFFPTWIRKPSESPIDNFQQNDCGYDE